MIWRSGRHLDDEALARLVDEGGGVELLSPEGQRHLRTCPRCMELLEGHRRARRLLLRADPPAALPAPFSGARSVNMRPQFAVSAAGLLVVVIAVAVIGRGLQAPSATTPSPSAHAGASASPSGQPSAVPSLATAGEWKILAASDVGGADWSPDGRWLIVWDGGNGRRRTSPRLTMRRAPCDADGTARSWLDAGSFVLVPFGRRLPGHRRLDALTPIRARSPRGRLERPWRSPTRWARPTQRAAVIWTRDGTSVPRPAAARRREHRRLAPGGYRRADASRRTG